MDRAALQRYLAAAEQRVAKGERCLERQRAIIHIRRSHDWDSREAEALLVEFEQAHTLDRADVDWLRKMLAASA